MKQTEKVKKVLTKICSKCGEEKPATTEYFGKAKRNKDGLRGQCKDCMKEYRKQYYKKNKEEEKESHKQYYKENKEKIKEYKKQYREENKEEIKEYQNQWYQENKEKMKEYNKQYHKENKEKIKEYNKQYHKQYRKENKEKLKELNNQWRKENKEYIKEHKKQYYKENKEYFQEHMKQWRKENIDRVRQHSQKRRASIKRLPHTLTLDQWEKIKNDFNNECAYCGKSEQEHKEEFNEQLHQEHFIPLSKGGGYTQNNIIPSCRNCNCSKHNTDFFEWYPTYEHYDKQREVKILEYINSQKGDEIYGNAI